MWPTVQEMGRDHCRLVSFPSPYPLWTPKLHQATPTQQPSLGLTSFLPFCPPVWVPQGQNPTPTSTLGPATLGRTFWAPVSPDPNLYP